MTEKQAVPDAEKSTKELKDFWNEFYSMTYDCFLEVFEERKQREIPIEQYQSPQQ